MVIIETSVFTRQVGRLLSEEEYWLLQLHLVLQPTAGSVIPGSGGLRKLRWPIRGRGKRGGARLIYALIQGRSRTLMLLIYSKKERDDLTREQIRILRRVVEENLR